MLKNRGIYFLITILIVVVLYPKFPLVSVAGSFVAVRMEDFILAGFAAIWFFTRMGSLKDLTKLPVHRAVILYLIIGSIATFGGIFVTYTATLNQGLLHLARRIEYFSIFFIAYDFLQTKQHLNYFIKAFLVVSALVAIYGIGQQYAGFPVISTTNSEFSKGLALSLGPGARINSTFAGHYDLAAFSVFPLLLCIGMMFLPVKNKWILVLIGGMSYWTMLLSASRVTFAATFITTAILLITLKKKIWLLPLGLLAIVSIIFTPQLAGRYRELILNHLVFVVPSVSAQEENQAVDRQVPDALKPAAQPEDRSLNIRLQAEWPKAIRSFKKNPILGTGYSSVGLAVDNDYLRALAETGAMGLAAFLLIIKRLKISTVLSTPKELTIETVFILTMMLGLLGVLLNGIFIDVFEASKIAIILWLIMGIAQKVKTWH